IIVNSIPIFCYFCHMIHTGHEDITTFSLFSKREAHSTMTYQVNEILDIMFTGVIKGMEHMAFSSTTGAIAGG
ncbi:hypothetical protein ACJX0J_008680, partial [Zea mays]